MVGGLAQQHSVRARVDNNLLQVTKTHTAATKARSVCVLLSQAGIIPRIFKYLWHRMPEVQADMLANPRSSSGDASNLPPSSSSAATEYAAEQGSYKWLVRCSMLEIHK